jgi:4-hydroxy-tetrahydrodipicolinate reductase
MTIKVAFLGLGKMGCAAMKAVISAEGMQVVSGFDSDCKKTDLGLMASSKEIGVKSSDVKELVETLKRTKPDVVVDFSAANACLENSKAVSAFGANMVIGTTGFTDAQLKELTNTLRNVGAVISPSMSMGVNVFWRLIREAACNLKGYDIEVLEAHHRFKKDAPSGTALKAVKVICDATGRDMKKDVVYGREGICPRQDGEIGVMSIRAGDIVGEHTVMFTTLGERFELKHIAHSRDSFASGIPQAIRFIHGKKGIYDMGDVLGLK